MSVSLRIAEGAERLACRMLLPEIADDPIWVDVRIATAGPTSQVVGASAWTPTVESDGTISARIALRVPRPLRRRGFGRAIVEASVAEARGRAARILVRSEPGEHPDARPFLEACGFTLVERQVFLAADYATARDRLTGLYRRLRSRGTIPSSARVVPLADAPLERLVELHVALVGGTPTGIADLLRRRIGAGTADDSLALLVDGRPEGLILFATRDGVTDVASRLVSPELQAKGHTSGWPNLMLMAKVFPASDRHAPRTLRFDCRASNRETLGLTRHLGANVERTADIHGRTLT